MKVLYVIILVTLGVAVGLYFLTKPSLSAEYRKGYAAGAKSKPPVLKLTIQYGEKMHVPQTSSFPEIHIDWEEKE